MLAISSVCLHGIGIGSIDFSVSVADCHRFLYIADALHFPNRPWLRSFRLAWGLGGKKGRMRDYNKTICKAFEVRLRLFLENLAEYLTIPLFPKPSRFYSLNQ